MDSSSSLYMCFPCCQLFSSLEDVLLHQQTCHPDDTGEEATQAASPGPQEEMPSQQCDHPDSPQPGLELNPNSPQQRLTDHLVDASQHTCCNKAMSHSSQVTPNGAIKDNQRQTDSCSVPLIRYQCGDCGLLFDSLAQWQHHRKLGLCTEPVAVLGGKRQEQCLNTLEDLNVKLYEQQAETEEVQAVGSDQGAEQMRDLGRQGGGGVKIESQPKCKNGERTVSQDHSYLPNIRGGEEDQEDLDTEAERQGSGPQRKILERGTETELRIAALGITALSCVTEKEPTDSQNSQTTVREQKLKRSEIGMTSTATSALTSQNFLCMYCGTGFSSESALVAHRKTRHGLEEAVHRCPVCKETFMSTTLFLYHRRQHRERQSQVLRPKKSAKLPLMPSSGGEERLKIDRWSRKANEAKVTRDGTCLQEAEENPSRSTLQQVTCPAYSSSPSQVLLDSTDSFPKPSNDFSYGCLSTSHACPHCGQAFRWLCHLGTHALSTGEKLRSCDFSGFFSCPRCSVQFSDHSASDAHIRSCPKRVKQAVGRWRCRNVEQLLCDVCGHCCMTQEGLDLHRLSHSGQTPLRCPLLLCRRRFITRSALEDHVLAHSQTPSDPTGKGFAPKPRPFHCERCSKSFTTASSLSVHLRIHTGERPYQCTQCGKRFRQIPHLRDHERLHSGLRPFSCKVCGKSFVLAARLAEHARTHSGEKPYTCPLCPRTFRSLSNLGKHRKTHSKSTAHKEASNTEEGETAVQTILLVQATPSVLQTADQAHLCQMSPPTMTLTSPASSPLVLLHPAVSVSKGQEEEEVTPVVQHAIEVIAEETVSCAKPV